MKPRSIRKSWEGHPYNEATGGHPCGWVGDSKFTDEELRARTPAPPGAKATPVRPRREGGRA